MAKFGTSARYRQPTDPRLAAFFGLAHRQNGEREMKKIIAVIAVTLPMLSSVAVAQERAGDAALGALSGAVVFGPIGAVAGALVGYTSGPSIAHSLGVRKSRHRTHSSGPVRANRRASRHVASKQGMADKHHPAQNLSMRSANQPHVENSPIPAAKPASAETAPPVQGFE